LKWGRKEAPEEGEAMSTMTLRSTLGFGRQAGGFRHNRPPRTDADLLVHHGRAFRQWRALIAVSGLLGMGVVVAGLPLAEANGTNRFRHLPGMSATAADMISPTDTATLGAASLATPSTDDDTVVTMPTLFISAHPQ